MLSCEFSFYPPRVDGGVGILKSAADLTNKINSYVVYGQKPGTT